MIWTVNTGRRQSPGLDIRTIYLGKPASTIQQAFGSPTDAKLVGTNGVWTYPGMKIRDAQGKTYNAVRFTIQPVPNGGGKVIAIDVIPGAIAGAVGGGGPGGGGPVDFRVEVRAAVRAAGGPGAAPASKRVDRAHHNLSKNKNSRAASAALFLCRYANRPAKAECASRKTISVVAQSTQPSVMLTP